MCSLFFSEDSKPQTQKKSVAPSCHYSVTSHIREQMLIAGEKWDRLLIRHAQNWTKRPPTVLQLFCGLCFKLQPNWTFHNHTDANYSSGSKLTQWRRALKLKDIISTAALIIILLDWWHHSDVRSITNILTCMEVHVSGWCASSTARGEMNL